MRESDIRARLGRLPKGLTGVYDEIINSIKSQPDCNINLAMHALAWILVSQRPLKPGELVAAAELNPSSVPVDSFTPSQESALEVELLIQSCKGLLLLDITLNVVRFSHLSVQEYLETRNEIIREIDAQLFVSKCCLWTLQHRHPLSSPLYEYAARNWFRHCRSYEDLVLAPATLKDTRYELCIPLLNRFLGSFKEASTSYAEWAEWVRADPYDRARVAAGGHRHYLLDIFFTTPHYPALFVAYAGLGEVVSWLWDSEVNDMKIKTTFGTSLLAMASGHGKTWVVTEILKVGFTIDTIQDALYPACRSGRLNTIKVLLAQGVDVNLQRGNGSTALINAVSHGDLEVVTLLLDRGADVNATSHMSGTALGAAASRGNMAMIELLLGRGADINATGGSGTALCVAALRDRMEIVELLLDRGADVNATGGDYGTALGAATYRDNVRMVELLLSRGADAKATAGGMSGLAAWQIACIR